MQSENAIGATELGWKPPPLRDLTTEDETSVGAQEQARMETLAAVRKQIEGAFSGIDLTKNTRMRMELASILSDVAKAGTESGALEKARERAFARIRKITDEHWERFES